MQIEWIDTFLDLCETRSFNQSAERLGVTQSTVSGRIRALEQVLGRRLFTRSRAGTDLTTEGLRFAPYARGLVHDWAEARNAVADTSGALAMRIGLQHDLVEMDFPGLIAAFRATLTDTRFSFEADYSAQMCADLLRGMADLAILFSPRYHPDLHFETIGEISYQMVSTEATQLREVTPERYILPHFSDAIPPVHARLLPQLCSASLSIGQNAAMVGLLRAMGGTAYVLNRSAAELVTSGICRRVKDAPPIPQPVFAGLHIRNRHRAAHRRLFLMLRGHFGTPTERVRAEGARARP